MGGVLLSVEKRPNEVWISIVAPSNLCYILSFAMIITANQRAGKRLHIFLVSQELHPTVHVFPRMLAERRPRLPAVVRGNEPAIFPWTVSVFSVRTEIAAEKRGVVSAWSHVNYTWWKHRTPKIRMHWHDMGHAVHIHVLSTPSAQLSWILLRNSCIFCQRP